MAGSRSFWITAIGLAVAGFAPAAAGEGDPVRGAELYDLCSQCHGPTGGGQELALAPAIAALPQWYVVPQLGYFRSGVRGMNPDDVGGLRMHPMSLSLADDADIADVSAYVASLPEADPAPVVEGGDPQRGAQRYALCAACHGANGAGNEQMKAPRLAGTSDWYLVSSLQKFKAGIRGSTPNGAVMRSFAAQLDEQGILDVVAYISTLSGE
jgi:cytochrome c553